MIDTWNRAPLSDAAELKDSTPIHYRIHDADGGGLLGFGTARPGPSGYLQVADHYRRIRSANPDRHLVLRRYNGPAGDEFSHQEGPA